MDRQTEFMRLVADHQLAIRSFVARLSPGLESVDDIAQEVFIKAFETFERYDPERDLLPWLRGIARNLCRSAWRKRGRRASDALEFALAEAAVKATATETLTERRARVQALRECVAALPPHGREAIEMRHQDGLSSAEIGKLLQRSPGAVNALFLRLRRNLRQCVEARLQGTGS